MVTLALEDEGYQVQTAADGQTALAILSDPHLQPGEFPFDLIVLDLMLPQVNGSICVGCYDNREIRCQS